MRLTLWAEYIVVFKDSTTQSEVDKAASDIETAGMFYFSFARFRLNVQFWAGGKITNRYDSVLKGFAAEIPDACLQNLQSLQGDTIDYIGTLLSL